MEFHLIFRDVSTDNNEVIVTENEGTSIIDISGEDGENSLCHDDWDEVREVLNSKK